jgi:hypothetical protein
MAAERNFLASPFVTWVMRIIVFRDDSKIGLISDVKELGLGCNLREHLETTGLRHWDNLLVLTNVLAATPRSLCWGKENLERGTSGLPAENNCQPQQTSTTFNHLID